MIGEHPPDLQLEDGRVAKLPRRRCFEQFVVRDAAPEEERKARGQLEIVDRIRRARLHAGRRALDPEQEVGIRQDADEGLLDSVVERAARVLPLAVELQERVEVVFDQRPPVGPAGNRRQDLGSAGLVVRAGRHADEQLAPRRAGGGPRRVERPGDRNPVEAHIDPAVVALGLPSGCVRVACRRQERHADAFDVPVVAVEGDPHRAHARRGREAHPQPLVLDILGVGVDAAAVDAATHLEQFELLPVEADIDVVHDLQAANLVADIQRVPLQPQLDLVLAVHREVVANGGAAARPERQVLAQALVLHEGHVGDVVGGRCGSNRGVAHGQTADLLGRQEIPLQQARRQRQHVGDVVESVTRIVGRQQVRRVNLHRQQVANGVRILGPVQAVHGRPSGIRRRGAVRVERGFDTADERRVGGARRARRTGRRHHAAAELADHLLPDLDFSAGVGRVEMLQNEPSRPQAVVVAADAVPLDHGVRSGIERRLGQGGRGRENRRGGGTECQDPGGAGVRQPL